jgi:hypothetical protein
MSDTILIERNTAGLQVEVKWLKITDTLVLHVEQNGVDAAVTIKPDRVFDAFAHPAMYLSKAQVEQLFAR